MPFGILEIVIVAVILFVIFGYRYLPQLGRRAGEGVNEVRGSVREMVGDKADPKTLGRSAGKGVRELREFRDAVTGKETAGGERPPAPSSSPGSDSPAATEPPEPAGTEEDGEPVEGEIVRGDERSS
jgi:Sec-independent protein translocase protein TatA